MFQGKFLYNFSHLLLLSYKFSFLTNWTYYCCCYGYKDEDIYRQTERKGRYMKQWRTYATKDYMRRRSNSTINNNMTMVVTCGQRFSFRRITGLGVAKELFFNFIDCKVWPPVISQSTYGGTRKSIDLKDCDLTSLKSFVIILILEETIGYINTQFLPPLLHLSYNQRTFLYASRIKCWLRGELQL